MPAIIVGTGHTKLRSDLCLQTTNIQSLYHNAVIVLPTELKGNRGVAETKKGIIRGFLEAITLQF